MSTKVPTESQEQMWLIQWSEQPSIRSRYPDLKYLFHIANERSDKVQAAILKKMGVRKGVPDLCLPVARGRYHGLYIEMKRTRDGRPSEEQLWWEEGLAGNGYATAICNGWKKASEILMWYLNLKGDSQNDRNESIPV